VVESWLIEATMALNCKTGQISFVYLGLPIHVVYHYQTFGLVALENDFMVGRVKTCLWTFDLF